MKNFIHGLHELHKEEKERKKRKNEEWVRRLHRFHRIRKIKANTETLKVPYPLPSKNMGRGAEFRRGEVFSKSPLGDLGASFNFREISEISG